MNDIAHISFDGGVLTDAARTPYDREQLFEHVEVRAKRHGSLRLALNRRRWTITVHDTRREPCAWCLGSPQRSPYRVDGETVCGRCARARLG